MRGISRSAVCLIAACALALVASNVQAGPLTVTKAISPQEQAAAAAYWTKERIAAAPALPMGIDSGREPDAALVMDEEAFVGRSGSSPAGAADPDAMEIVRAAYAEDWAALDGDSPLEKARPEEIAGNQEKGTSAIYTYYDVNIQTAFSQIYPHIWDGKLTFTTDTGGGASCSATAISGNNWVTAAHCVHNTTNNKFYSNFVFTPAYRNGSAPYGSFAATFCTILTAYVNLTGGYNINTWARHDVAVCTAGTNSIGQTLNNAVGFAGRAWGQSYTQQVFNSGYPAKIYTDANIANATQYLRACAAETFQRTTDTLGCGCYYGRGISGGSWLKSYKPFVVSGQVLSVNSGLIIGQQNLYGARFTTNNIVPLCNARSC